MVYRPPWQKIARTPMIGATKREDDDHDDNNDGGEIHLRKPKKMKPKMKPNGIQKAEPIS